MKRKLEYLGERLGEYLLPMKGSYQAVIILLAMVIGVLGAYGAILFRLCIRWSHLLFFSTTDYGLDALQAVPWWNRLLLPTAGGVLVGFIVTRLAPEVKGSGIPEVMEAVAWKGGIIRLRVLVTKIVAVALTIGSGGSAGREGPIVHIGSAIASAIGQFLGLSARYLRTFVACGAAAGIAATFNAPIAGALFSLEVIVGNMKVVNLPPIVISAVVATVISRHHLGDYPAFVTPPYDLVSPLELLPYAGLGLAAGLIASLFILLFIYTGRLFERSKAPVWVRPAIGGLGVGFIALGLPHVFGVGYETIGAALSDRLATWILVAIVFAKLLATCLTLGSGGSGGVFAPSLVLGATLGAAWGQVAHHLFPSWTATPGAYALVGMGAMVSAVTFAPISAILIIFEMTNNYLVIPPLMLSSVISVLLANLLVKRSIYVAKLEARGVQLRQGKEPNVLRTLKVRTLLETEVLQIPTTMGFNQVLSRLLKGNRPVAVAIDESGAYVGTIELEDIREILPLEEKVARCLIALDLANTDMPFVLPEDNLDLVMHIFGRTDRDAIAVCETVQNRKVIGLISRSTAINAYNQRIFEEDLAGGFGSIMETVTEGRTIEILGGLHLGEIEVPAAWVGKTLREADLRKNHQIEVVLVHRESGLANDLDGRPGMFPSPDLKLEPGDKLLVIGMREVIRAMKA
ncbi:MAG: chloride channel protein [Bradymonadales bacterium]|nr:chloride channel protein [Bradymonadales bacterium]